MSKLDVVIKGGTLIDGMQTPRYKADIGISGGRVTRIGRVDVSEGREVVDASGKVVAPGFVDLHTHYDSQVFWDPWCTMSGWHGVTSVVIGNCGFGFAPCKPEDQERAMLTVSRNEAVPLKTMRVGMPWDWTTYPEFLDSVDRTPKGVNVMSFVPLAPLYAYVAGVDNAKAYRVTTEQLDEMCRLLVEGMEAGGCGFSAQVSGEVGNVQLDFDGTPMVTDCMTEEEVIAFSRAMGSLGRGTAQLTGTLETAGLMARESGRPIIWNALLADGALNQHGGAKYTTRRRAQAARLHERGGRPPGVRPSPHDELRLRVHARGLQPRRHHPVLEGSVPRDGRREDREVRRPGSSAAMKEVHEERGGLFGAGYDLSEIKINWISSDVPNAQNLKETYEGFTVAEVAAREGKHEIDAFLDVAVAGQLRVGFATKMLETPPESMKEIATSPMALPGVSDGGAHTKFVTTARYPTELLGYWVREHEIMSLEQAHWRLSYYPAMAAGLKGRGFLAEGAPGGRRRLRPEHHRCHPARAGVGLPGGGVAPDPEGRRL